MICTALVRPCAVRPSDEIYTDLADRLEWIEGVQRPWESIGTAAFSAAEWFGTSAYVRTTGTSEAVVLIGSDSIAGEIVRNHRPYADSQEAFSLGPTDDVGAVARRNIASGTVAAAIGVRFSMASRSKSSPDVIDRPSSTVVTAIAEARDELHTLRDLVRGWDSYNAAPPADVAIVNAERFLDCLVRRRVGPSWLSATVVGGVGITFDRDSKRAYVEFRNSGTINALFSGDGAAAYAKTFRTDGFDRLITEVEAHLK